MSWMDLTEYALITEVARDRLDDLRRPRRGTGSTDRTRTAPPARLAKILYIASALRARPRAIDRYIDYFGDRVVYNR
jgi:hypothetical protein